jgi:hypothetical protein
MKRTVLRSLTMICALAAPLAFAQSNSPAAYIYVSSGYPDSTGSGIHVVGYAAAADGTLTEIPGSPWADRLDYLATNGTYLFGSTGIANDNGKNIFSYKIESDGALKYIGANNIQDAGSQNACNMAGPLMLDHTGSDLYVYVWQAKCTSEQGIQSFAVNWKTGLLNYTGVSSPQSFDNNLGYPLSMAADNTYVYSSGVNAIAGELCGFQKASTGAIDYIPPACGDTPWPSGVPSGWNENAGIVAADPTNHMAMSITFEDPNGNGATVIKIETIAIDSTNGSLSTSSTFSNMPDTLVGDVTSLVMAPSGKLLAIGGDNGVQIFNFDPNGQATANTGLISAEPLQGTYTGQQMYWDTSNHLYVISSDNTLRVFTVTPLGAIGAPGSPYTIQSPVAITGHSL